MIISKIEELRTVISVAKHKSFAHASRELGISTSGVSKQIATLENRLDVRLFNRSTRSVTLTDVGARFIEGARDILIQLEDLEKTTQGTHTAPRGVLRVSAPQDFGRFFLSTIMVKFADLYPDLRVELELTDRLVDVVEEGFDAVVRLAKPHDSSLVMRRIAICERVLCASPEYLEKYGEPSEAVELSKHCCIEYEYLADQRWKFLENGKRKTIVPSGRMKANAGWSMRDMTLASLGIALLPRFLVQNDIESGQLTTILDESLDENIDMMVLIPHRKQLATKVRIFIDYLINEIQSEPWYHN